MSRVLTQAVAVASPLMGGSPDAGPSSLVIRQATPSSSSSAASVPTSNGTLQQSRHTIKPASPAKSPSLTIKTAASPARKGALASTRFHAVSRLNQAQSGVSATPPAGSWLKWDHLQPSLAAPAREYVDLTVDDDDDGPYVDLTQDEPVTGVVLREPSSSPAKPSTQAQPLLARQPLQSQSAPQQQRGPRHVKALIPPPADEPRPRSELYRDNFDEPHPHWQSGLRLQKRPKNQEASPRPLIECDWAIRKAEFSAKEYRMSEQCKRTFHTAEALFRHVVKHVKKAQAQAQREAKRAPASASSSNGLPRSSSSSSLSLSNPQQAKVGCCYGDCANKLKTWLPDDIVKHVRDVHFGPLAWTCPFESCRLSDSKHYQLSDPDALLDHVQASHEAGEALRPLAAPVKPPTTLAPPPPLPGGIVAWHTVVMPDRIKVVKTDWRPVPHVPKAAAEGVLAEPAAPAEPGVQPWPKLIQMWTHLEPPAIPLKLEGEKMQELEGVYIDAPRGPPIEDREPADFSKAELARMRHGQPPVKRLRISRLLTCEEADYVDLTPGREDWEESKPSLRRIPVFPRRFEFATPPPPRIVPDMPEWSESESDEEEDVAVPRHWPVFDVACAGVAKPWLIGDDAAAVAGSSSAPTQGQQQQQQQGQQVSQPRPPVPKTVWTSVTPFPGRSTLSKETVRQRRRDAGRPHRLGPMAALQQGKILVRHNGEQGDVSREEESDEETKEAAAADAETATSDVASVVAATAESASASADSVEPPASTLKQSSLTSFCSSPASRGPLGAATASAVALGPAQTKPSTSHPPTQLLQMSSTTTSSFAPLAPASSSAPILTPEPTLVPLANPAQHIAEAPQSSTP